MYFMYSHHIYRSRETMILAKSFVLQILFQALSRDQVVAVHIDNGFMRKNESHQVEESLKRLGVKLKG